MPSIPQSLLWISLVVLWLFVLVPMLINKRDTVRRTSDVALATRVLNGRTKSRLIRKGGPAAGHRHDPDWQPEAEDYPDHFDEAEQFAEQEEVIRVYDDAVREARMGGRIRSVVVVAAMSERTVAEPDYLDVDVVDEDSGALPVGGTGVKSAAVDDRPQPERQAPAAPEPIAEPVAEAEPEMLAEPVAEADPAVDPTDEFVPAAPGPVQEPGDARKSEPRARVSDEYEYVEDSSGLEDEPREAAPPLSASRQRRMENTTAAAVEARKYRFRKRVLTFLAALLTVSAVLSFVVDSALWWACGAVGALMVIYLGYLRRQTRIEAQVRRRRQQRQARVHPFAEEAAPPRRPEVDFDEFPTRLQRPGAVVLEIDDEDPVFEHLDEMAYSGSRYRPTHEDLRRASGL